MFILGEEDFKNLVELGEASSLSSGGMIRLHKRRVNRPFHKRSSDEENANSPLPPISATSSSLDFITIPDTFISLATLIYLGFTKEEAEKVWNKWTNWPYPRETDPDDEDSPWENMRFIDFILLHMGSDGSDDDNDTYSENNEEWYSCMVRYGINDELQTAIMDPYFDSIRHTETCLHWLRDSMESRYHTLEEVQAASSERERAIQRAQEHPGGSQNVQH